jgi:hypothetical protein
MLTGDKRSDALSKLQLCRRMDELPGRQIPVFSLLFSVKLSIVPASAVPSARHKRRLDIRWADRLPEQGQTYA